MLLKTKGFDIAPEQRIGMLLDVHQVPQHPTTHLDIFGLNRCCLRSVHPKQCKTSTSIVGKQHNLFKD